MAQTKREAYERRREYIRELAADSTIATEDAEAILEWGDAYDGEKATATPNANGDYVGDDRWGNSRAPSTLRQWMVALTMYAERVDGTLLDATSDHLNRISQEMKDGDGVSKSTISTRQNCLRKFLQHFDGQAMADPDAIHIFDKEGAKIDPADMLTEEEFHAMRTAPEHPRDVAVVNLFMYTGQRNHAIRTLRIKDVNLEEGTYRLNTDVDGLKGAEEVATWNPLLGSNKPVREWVEKHHPAPDDGAALLITERQDHRERDPYSTISDDTVNWVLRRAAEKAADEYPAIANKPTHAHAIRHNFVTMCKVRYDMDNDTIKRLIRHKPDSSVMETTYAHLSDADYIKKAEEAFGIRDSTDEEDAFDASPEFCDVCHEPLQRGAKACPSCGAIYSPDAHSAKQKIQSGLEGQVGEIQNEAEARVVRAALQEIRENPPTDRQ
jgi:integrase